MLDLNCYKFNAKAKDGPRLLVLGLIHGDEVCGGLAINRVIYELSSQQLQLQQGQLRLVPIANPLAFAQGVRFVNRDLNRSLYPRLQPKIYEEAIGNQLCELISQADYLVDLHSYAAAGGPLVFLGRSNTAEIEFGHNLGLSDFVYGWQDSYEQASHADSYQQGTTEYARSLGKLAVTVECGNHNNRTNAEVGYQAIKGALSYLQMLKPDGHLQPKRPANLAKQQVKIAPQYYRIQQVIYKQAAGEFEKNWCNLQAISKGQILASYRHQDHIIAEQDSYILLPYSKAAIGKEWFYLAQSTARPQPLANNN